MSTRPPLSGGGGVHGSSGAACSQTVGPPEPIPGGTEVAMDLALLETLELPVVLTPTWTFLANSRSHLRLSAVPLLPSPDPNQVFKAL